MLEEVTSFWNTGEHHCWYRFKLTNGRPLPVQYVIRSERQLRRLQKKFMKKVKRLDDISRVELYTTEGSYLVIHINDPLMHVHYQAVNDCISNGFKDILEKYESLMKQKEPEKTTSSAAAG